MKNGTAKCLLTVRLCRYYPDVLSSILQNRGIYMFRINNEQVIDATLTGGPAR